IFELHLSAPRPAPAVITFTKRARQQVRPRGSAANMIGRNAQNMDFAMAAPLKTVEGSNIAALMHEIGPRAKSAARVLALAPTAQKDRALAAMAAAIRARRADILAANAKDGGEARAAAARAAFPARPALGGRRPAARADALDGVRPPADPVGAVTGRWTRPNGMPIERVRVPIGVVGIIYESRPNVTADAAAL